MYAAVGVAWGLGMRPVGRGGLCVAARPRVVTAWRCYASPPPVPGSAVAAAGDVVSVRVGEDGDKARLDGWLSGVIEGRLSRSKVTAAVKGAAVSVNGAVVTKQSHKVRAGDLVELRVPEEIPTMAEAEALPLEVVYEDAYLLVINKAAGMVVHPSPGHPSGTLVNAVLHHCGVERLVLSSAGSSSGEGAHVEDLGFEDGDLDEEEDGLGDKEGSERIEKGDEEPSTAGGFSASLEIVPGVVRPGIVHRLDKGTSGLIVVAKDDRTLAALSAQFKARTTGRLYQSLVCGNLMRSSTESNHRMGLAASSPALGRVVTLIGRDPLDRKRMAVLPATSKRGKRAASKFKVTEELAGGAACACEWRLETGRTHQIRVHAKHLGHPLLADEIYGGTRGMCMNRIEAGSKQGKEALIALASAYSALGPERPALHASDLSFDHPATGERLVFHAPPPKDFIEALAVLRGAPR